MQMIRNTVFHFVLLAVALWGFSAVEARQIYVSPSGDDTKSGAKEDPIASIHKAIDLLPKEPSRTIILRGGSYRIDRPIHFSANHSGSSKIPVVLKAFPGEVPVISGSKTLSTNWKIWKDGIYRTKIDSGQSFDLLFANGKQQTLARYPNYDKTVSPFGGFAADVISKKRIAKWASPKGAYLHSLHGARWGGYHHRIIDINSDGSAKLEGGWQNNRPEHGPHAKFRFVENVLEELDADSEWYLDKNNNFLYWKPASGVDPKTAKLEVPVVEHLVEMVGRKNQPVRFIRLQGIVFRHSKRTFMKSKERLLRSDWAFYRGGAIWLKNARDCSISNCRLSSLGGNAIVVDSHARRIRVSGNEISSIGASAICFVGSSNAVRSPNFQYSKFTRLEEMDREIGPKTDDFPADCVAHDNLIYDIGQIEKQSAGVQIAMASRIRVSHNSIYDVPRAGINVGDGTWGGHIIEGNDVFDTVKETSDHGSFNSWGRDRYWSSSARRVNQYVKSDPSLPLLDAVETTHIRNNRFRCDHGWDIDLDDGSTNYQIYNNLCLRNGIKLREGFYRHVFNNVVVNNSMHVHVWYDRSGDVIEHNLFGSWYFPIRMPKVWGKSIDQNLFDIGEKPSRWNESGRDLGSIISNPRFIDPEKGDYRVAHQSPAWQLGFHNFSMDNFGVISPHLKKKARTPKLPNYNAKLKVGQKPLRDPKVYPWLGGKVKNLVGMGEVSATGMTSETGVLVVEVPTGSQLAKYRFREGDVVLQFWGSPVENLNSLKRHYNSRPKHSKIPITIMRNQAKTTLNLD